ncbi:MAG TPA: alkaline phosphatase family protein [Anaerolineae bacterium]
MPVRSFKRAIVIGLDGLEPKITESLLDAGQLPNLARLRQQGGYGRVRTTYPAQTPVAWSTFATGTNPGGHGVFDFIGRDLKSYFPILALNHYEQKNVFLPPKVVNGRRGVPLWEILSNAGISSTVLRHPLTYPPDNIRGQVLGGVGVPDLRGGLGTPTFYTSEPDVKAQEGESVVQVRPDADNSILTYLLGPRDPKTGSDIRFELTLRLDAPMQRITLRSAGQPKELEIRERQWSDWLKVKFKVGPLLSVRGMVRFYLIRLGPVFELYASPVQFDPEAPLFPISQPPEYAKELEARLGTFYTAGMVEEDTGLKNRRISEEAFLAQCDEVLREREKMMLGELGRQREGFFFCLFDTPDRLQHVFWRFLEPDHPANRGDVTLEMQRVIAEHYGRLDGVVGQALKHADDRTLFIVLSDHGMNSFQRGFNVNTWLQENGWLVLQDGTGPGEEAGDLLRRVDWSRTKAYALGLSGIYFNLEGREAKGIVRSNKVEELQGAITQRLTGLADPVRGKTAVRSVFKREQVYRGPYAGEAPDLLINFAEGYRASWHTPLGGVPAGCFEDNEKKWGGDHCIDPELVPGVLFMNRPFKAEHPSMVDLAPTILEALGLAPGSEMEGESLLRAANTD